MPLFAKNFFGRDPRTLEMVARLSDDDIWRLNRGGHDPQKVYAAYHAAVNHKGQPTVLLIKTVKGFGMGKVARARTPRTNQSSPTRHQGLSAIVSTSLCPTKTSPSCPSHQTGRHTPEMKYLHERRRRWAAICPSGASGADEPCRSPICRRSSRCWSPPPRPRNFTTQAFVRCLTPLLRDASLGLASCPFWWTRLAPSACGRPVPPDWHLCARRPESTRSIAIRSCTTAKTRPGRFCKRASAKPGHEFLDRRGHVVLDEQPRDDSVLRVLLNVRPATGGRPGLGGGRHAGAWRCLLGHLRPHHTQWRRLTARRQAQSVGGKAPFPTA